jgi:hypothetical protein
MADEDLQRNAFWVALNKKAHSALFSSVAQKRLIVCVPVQASMPAHVVLDKYYLESHIFEASAFFPNEFMSVNRKTVEISNKRVDTKRGYPEKRSVRVLAEEAFYSSHKEPFRVLFLDSPLEGPARALAQTIALPSSHRFEDVLAFMLSFAENKLVLQKQQRLIDQFNESYLLVAAFEHNAVERVRSICNQMLEQLVCANPDFRQLYNGSDRQLAELTNVVDSFCLGKLHAKLFSGLRVIHADADAAALAKMQRLAHVPTSVLGVPPEASAVDVTAAVELVRRIDAYVSPLSKLEMLNEVQELLVRALANPTNRDARSMSIDDTLPLMVLVTVRAAPQYLSSTIAYVTLFGHAETMPPQLSYQLTTLHAIFEFISNAAPNASDTASLDTDTSDPLSRTLSAPRTVAEALAAHIAPAGGDSTSSTSSSSSSSSSNSDPLAARAQEEPPARAIMTPRNSLQYVRAPAVISLDGNDEKHGLGDFLESLRRQGNVSSQQQQQPR